MFIYNIKVSGSKLFKIFAITVSLIIISVFIFSIYHIFSLAKNDPSGYSISSKEAIQIDAKNYTNILKSVHDDLNTYLGKTITFSGYIYRTYDFSESQFVLARDMMISSDNQSLIVGFLCNYPEIKKYKDYTWIEITGEITKGNYHGEIPIIEVTNLKEIQKPSEEYVYPPDDTYVATSTWL